MIMDDSRSSIIRIHLLTFFILVIELLVLVYFNCKPSDMQFPTTNERDNWIMSKEISWGWPLPVLTSYEHGYVPLNGWPFKEPRYLRFRLFGLAINSLVALTIVFATWLFIEYSVFYQPRYLRHSEDENHRT